MTMPLLRLPYVVLRELLPMLDVIDVISLSLISKRSAKTVQSVKYKLPPVAMDITIAPFNKTVTLCHNSQQVLQWQFSDYNMRGKRVNYIANKTEFQIVICKKFPNLRQSLVMFPPHNKHRVVDAVISHFLNIFPSCTVTKVFIRFTSAIHTNSRSLKYKEALRSITKTEFLHIDQRGTSTDLGAILKNTMVTRLYIDLNLEYKCSPVVDQMMCSDLIETNNATWMPPATLLRLNCTRVFLLKTKFTKKVFMDFLIKWKNSVGDDMKRFEEMDIHHPLGVGRMDYDMLDAKPWDPDTRPQVFIRHNYQRTCCSTAMDIKRSDGLLGSILQPTENVFSFFVWHPDDDQKRFGPQ